MNYEIVNAAEWDKPQQRVNPHLEEDDDEARPDANTSAGAADVHQTVKPSPQVQQSNPAALRGQYADHETAKPQDWRGATRPQLQSRAIVRQPHEKFWPKVRPENDYFGLEAEKTRKKQQKVVHNERRRQACERNIAVFQGVYILSHDKADSQEGRNVVDNTNLSLDSRIEYDPSQNIARISAQDYETIRNSLQALRASISSSPSRNSGLIFIIEPPANSVSLRQSLVHMTDARSETALPKAAGLTDNRGVSSAGMCEMVPHVSLQAKQSVDFVDESRLLRRNALALRISIQKSLARLHSRKGTIQMRLSFGALVFHRFPWPTGVMYQAAEVFIEKIRNPRTRASLYKLSPASDLYGHVTKITNFFLPYAPEHKTLAETAPFFVGRFIWPSTLSRKFHMAFEATTEAIQFGNLRPRVLDRNWLRLEEADSHRELNAMITQMNGGLSCALQVDLKANTDDSWKPPGLLAASQIPFAFENGDYVETASKGLLVFDPRASGCHAYKQRTVWRFRLKMNSSFVFELTRYDSFNRWEGQANLEVLDRRSSETRWDARIYSESWPGALVHYQNREEKITDGSTDPSLDTFFPSCGYKPGAKDGFEDFFFCVRDILSSLNQEERERLCH